MDYDGVPWNNNNAENALKLVASRRRLFGTSVSEAGLKDYLVFLSIYQTLRRKGISLLRFLLSGETDLGEVRGVVSEAMMRSLRKYVILYWSSGSGKEASRASSVARRLI